MQNKLVVKAALWILLKELKENKRLQQEMEMLKKDYNTEMERLEKENSQLKARARKEKEEKEEKGERKRKKVSSKQ